MKFTVIIVCLLASIGCGCDSKECTGKNLPSEERLLNSVKYCNVCRSGGQILNPSHAFIMEGKDESGNDVSYDYTCGLLQEYVADVLETGGAPNEALWCDIHQLWAKKGGCECSGVEPPPQDVHSANPKCDLCAGQELNYVPEALAHELAPTGVAGEMACGGLYKALALGVMTTDWCDITQKSAGPKCCNIPVLDNPPPSTEDAIPSSTEDATTTQMGTICRMQNVEQVNNFRGSNTFGKAWVPANRLNFAYSTMTIPSVATVDHIPI